MVKQEIIIAKLSNINKNLERIKGKKAISFAKFVSNKDIQDIIIFNLQNSIQGCTDLASHIVADNGWGVSGSMAGLFDILFEHKVITDKTRKFMRQMVGFRNIIVHEYAKLDMKIAHQVYTDRINYFRKYLKEIIQYCKL